MKKLCLSLLISGIMLVFLGNTTAFAAKKSLANANQSTSTTTVNINNATGSDNATVDTEVHYCPDPSELIKVNLHWSAREGRWKSYSQSFADTIVSFRGAEWLGVVYGKIICLYAGGGSSDFPIALEPATTILVPEPTDTNWKTQPSGYKLCTADNVTDCKFISKDTEETIDKAYQEIHYKAPSPDAGAAM